MSEKKLAPWVIALAGLLVGGAIGAGAATALHQRELARMRSELSATQSRLDDTSRALDELNDIVLSPADTPGDTAAPGTTDDAASPGGDVAEKQFAFVTRLAAGNPGTIELDYAEFLTGDAASQVAADRGDESPPPNDYYIVNENRRLRAFKIAPDAKIRLVTAADGTSDPAGYDSDLAGWAAYFADDESAGIRNAGYWFTIDAGVVTRVEEQFLP